MKEFDIHDGTHLIAGEIAARTLTAPRGSLIVGITGPVASGKTRFTHSLMHLLREALHHPIVHVPFDYWINTGKSDAATYSERFHLDDYYQALQSMADGDSWMYPRYDLIKRGYTVDKWKLPAQGCPDLIWQQRRFRKIEDATTRSNINDVESLYIEASTHRLFSLFPAVASAIYLIDGTLIFNSQQIRSLFGIRVFCFSNWPNRIARMIRRYRRGEVFGRATTSLEKYVGFLAREAKDCADTEIAAQVDEGTFVVRSSVETISNLLDLYVLKVKLLKGEQFAIDVGVLSVDVVDRAIEEAVANLKALTGGPSTHVVEELRHLQESRHLLSIEKADSIFSDLCEALSQESLTLRQPKGLTVM